MLGVRRYWKHQFGDYLYLTAIIYNNWFSRMETCVIINGSPYIIINENLITVNLKKQININT
jgi:hypothetical protein